MWNSACCFSAFFVIHPSLPDGVSCGSFLSCLLHLFTLWENSLPSTLLCRTMNIYTQQCNRNFHLDVFPGISNSTYLKQSLPFCFQKPASPYVLFTSGTSTMYHQVFKLRNSASSPHHSSHQHLTSFSLNIGLLSSAFLYCQNAFFFFKGQSFKVKNRPDYMFLFNHFIDL